MRRNPTFRLCKNGEVERVPIQAGDKRIASLTLCYIESEIQPLRTTRTYKFEYHTCIVLDTKRQPVEGNSFSFQGTNCHLEAVDSLTFDSKLKYEFGINGTVLVAHITDLLGHVRKVLFDNVHHNGNAFRQLLEYSKDLSKFGTHDAMKEIWDLNRLLEKKDRKIDQMTEAYRKSLAKKL